MSRMQCAACLVLVVAVAGQLSACSGGGGGGGGDVGGGIGGGGDLTQANEFCHTIPPVSSGCSPCVNTDNPVAVFDANLATYSEMSSGGQSNFVGRSSEVQAAGSLAGVYFLLPNPAGITITLSTYRNGVQQETSAPVSRQTPSDNCSGLGMDCQFRDGAESFVGMGTNLEYDEIRAAISNSSADDVLVYELCVR